MQNKTIEQYLAIAYALLKRYENETGEAWQDDVMAFCHWFVALSEEWSQSTWRLRKNAVLYFMRENGPQEAINYLETVAKLKSATVLPLQTSQKKSKLASMSDLTALVEALEQSRSSVGNLTAHWLIAGLFTGVRPIEWFGSKILDENSIEFINAKTNANRACGPTRVLQFTENANDEHKKIIFEFIEEINQRCPTMALFEATYESCRTHIKRTRKKLWPHANKQICLYSTRHQFSANCKAQLDLVSVAALMGHRSTETAAQHYLKRRYGSPEHLIVSPSEVNMKLVNDTHVSFTKDNRKTQKNGSSNK